MPILNLSEIGKRPQEPSPRPTAHQRGYTYEWSQYSKQFRLDHPMCQGYAVDAHGQALHTEGCQRMTEHVDHIVAVTGPDDPLFWEPSNHAGRSHSCHSRKTVREDGGRGRRRQTKTRESL